MFDKLRYTAIRESSTSSRFFSGSKNLSLDSFEMYAECLRNSLSNKLSAKMNGKRPVEDHQQDDLIMSRALVGNVREFD